MARHAFLTDRDDLLAKRRRAATKQELDRKKVGGEGPIGPGGAHATEGVWVLNEGNATGVGWSLTFDDNGDGI